MNGFVFDKGIDITPVQSPMGFTYGAGVFGPEVEIRRLEDIRASLRDPQCKGPEQVTRSLWMSAKKNIVRC